MTPWTVTPQDPFAMGFSRQEYWSGLPSPSPGDLPNPGIESTSLESPAFASGFFSTAPFKWRQCQFEGRGEVTSSHATASLPQA